MRILRICFPLVLIATSCDFRVGDDVPGSSSYGDPDSPPLPPEPPPSTMNPIPPVDGADLFRTPCAGSIDLFKELLVIDPAVLASSEARNDVAGAAFSFRSRLEELSESADDAARFAVEWLESWKSTTQVGLVAAVQPRFDVENILVEPWKQAGGYGMSFLPFRLIAIVNRLDLASSADGCTGDAGEIRFVYTAVNPSLGNALAMTVIVEVPYPSTRSPRAWADAWHALPSPASSSYVPALAALVRDAMRDADPERTRVRTNEIALGQSQNQPWELRQFALMRADGQASLAPTLIATTPRDDLDGSSSLGAWIEDHRDRLAKGVTDALAITMQAGASSMPEANFRWTLASAVVPESVRHTFGLSTCNGCHGGERPADVLPFQHLAPGDAPNSAGYYDVRPTQRTRVSTFLYDGHGGGELVRRAQSMASILCSSCSPGPGSGVPPDSYPSCR